MNHEAFAFKSRTERSRHDYEFERSPDYVGPLADLDEQEAKAQMIELLAYFGHREGFNLPFPPRWLPGVSDTYLRDDDMWFLQKGFDYFVALLHGRPRRQFNLLKEMGATVREEYLRGRREEERDRFDAAVQYAERQIAEQIANPTVDSDMVYFIGSEGGTIKIGIAADPKRRLKNLQTSHPARLSILATCPGGRRQEKAYHAQFAAHRLTGEWFTRCPEIEAEITRLSIGGDQK